MEFTEGGAGLDEVKRDVEHGVAGELERDEGVSVLMQDDGDGSQGTPGEVDVFEVLEIQLFLYTMLVICSIQ
jgi:hypothetical protein